MRLTIIHTESRFFGGAQKMLGYFIETAASRWDITVALAPNPKLERLIPPSVRIIHLPSNQQFSPLVFLKQLRVLTNETMNAPQVVHGWAARDWELTAAIGKIQRAVSVGSLHDHPQASFISPLRRKLMWGASVLGLDQVVCVSEAVKRACLQAGYDPSRLAVIRNGLPLNKESLGKNERGNVTFGFIGGFSEGKGLRGLFSLVHILAGLCPEPWELLMAGGAQDDRGRRMMDEIRSQYGNQPWWPRVKWLGWVENPRAFFDAIDILLFPSTDFDSFPTVLLEAGQAGIPALATRVGGVPEIIVDGVTGWVIDAGDWQSAARILAAVLPTGPAGLIHMGLAARLRMERFFTVERMADDHVKLYDRLSGA